MVLIFRTSYLCHIVDGKGERKLLRIPETQILGDTPPQKEGNTNGLFLLTNLSKGS